MLVSVVLALVRVVLMVVMGVYCCQLRARITTSDHHHYHHHHHHRYHYQRYHHGDQDGNKDNNHRWQAMRLFIQRAMA